MSRHFNNVGEKASRYQGEHFRQSKQKIYAIGMFIIQVSKKVWNSAQVIKLIMKPKYTWLIPLCWIPSRYISPEGSYLKKNLCAYMLDGKACSFYLMDWKCILPQAGTFWTDQLQLFFWSYDWCSHFKWKSWLYNPWCCSEGDEGRDRVPPF